MMRLPLNDRLAVLQTCSTLRRKVTGMPELWSNVFLAPQQRHVGQLAWRAVNWEAKWGAALDILSRCPPEGTRLLCLLDILVTTHLMTQMLQRSLRELPFMRIEVFTCRLISHLAP